MSGDENEKLSGPVYPSWDAAMADADLDLSKPWFVAAEPAETGAAIERGGWPGGWVKVGITREGSVDDVPPSLGSGKIEVGPGTLYVQPLNPDVTRLAEETITSRLG